MLAWSLQGEKQLHSMMAKTCLQWSHAHQCDVGYHTKFPMLSEDTKVSDSKPTDLGSSYDRVKKTKK